MSTITEATLTAAIRLMVADAAEVRAIRQMTRATSWSQITQRRIHALDDIDRDIRVYGPAAAARIARHAASAARAMDVELTDMVMAQMSGLDREMGVDL